MSRARADQLAVNELQRVMQAVMKAVEGKAHAAAAMAQGVSMPGMPGGQGDLGSDEGLSWHEPKSDMFYALDDKSGARLAKVLDDLRNAPRYIARGAPAPSRQLFIGKPGNGKTTGVLWLGGQLNLPVALIRLDGVASSLVGKKEKNLRACIESAMKRPCIIALDEFESVAVPRSNQGPNVGQWSRDCTGALLQLIDSLPPDQAFIGCTNHPEAIDAAVMERMRDYVVFYPPNRDTRSHMINAWWNLAPYDGAAKRVLLDKTEGFSGRRLQTVTHAANRTAARRGAEEDITVADVEEAIRDALDGRLVEDVAEALKAEQAAESTADAVTA
jgi:AAA+ superfamily predicted ATPase